MGFLKKLEIIPSQYRWAMIPGLLLLLGVAYWQFLYQPRAEALTLLDEEIARKNSTLNEHRQIAATYDKFKEQVEELEDELRQALAQLPDSKEIPDLIRQISDLGVRSGLQITLLRPQAERLKEFYAEVPITLKVVGPFHAVGRFYGDLARLPRIVSVSQVKMGLKDQAKAESLETECVAITFRFLEEEETAEVAASKKSRRKQ